VARALLLRSLVVPVVVSASVVGTASATAVLARPSVPAVVAAVDVAPLHGGPVLHPRPVPAPVAAAKAAPPAPPVLARRESPRRAVVPAVRESRQAYADRRGRAALAALGFPTERLGYAIVFRPSRGGLLGLADEGTRTITVYVRHGQSERSLRVTIAHEIGHVVDYLTRTDAKHRAYLQARGLRTDTPWYPCNGCSDYASPAGDFAEVFALWLAGPGDFRSRMAGPPTRSQLHDLGLRFFQPPS
jgi:hypothetical protein